ncbi:hypothetical protein ACYOEI_06770 [Singulisphaera rosea]
MKRSWVIHPFVFAIYPIIALYARVAIETRAVELIWPVGLALAVTALLWMASRLAVRENARAGLLTSIIVILFVTIYQATSVVNEVLSVLSGIWVWQLFDIWPPYVMVPECILFAIFAYFALVKLKNPTALNHYLNIFAIILIVLPTIRIVRVVANEPKKADLAITPLVQGSPPRKRPDVYYIILDGFARGDILREMFAYDLDPFLEHLEGKGFYVARRSTSNYCQTPLSLTSSLNGRHLQGLIPPSSQDTSQLTDWIAKGAVGKTFQGYGYKSVSYSSGFEQTENPSADEYRSLTPYISGFHHMLLTMTPFSGLHSNPLAGLDSYLICRKRTLYILDTIADITADPAPTFTFAHILCPHPPFVFGEDGEDISPHGTQFYLSDGRLYKAHYGGLNNYITGYRKQAAYMVKRVQAVIDDILARSPEPPIIILQSDHGSGSGLDTESLEGSDVKERMSILNAYYFPEKKYDRLYDRISPVNSFRVLFNTVFAAELPLLPDRCFFSTWIEPFNFIDVTDRVITPVGKPPESPQLAKDRFTDGKQRPAPAQEVRPAAEPPQLKTD